MADRGMTLKESFLSFLRLAGGTIGGDLIVTGAVTIQGVLTAGVSIITANLTSIAKPIILYNSTVNGGFAIGVAEDWHEVGATSEPAFENSWTNSGGGTNTLAFRKDVSGYVHVKGRVTGGASGTSVFTFPQFYRPILDCRYIGIVTAGGIVRIDVTSAGVLTLTGGSVASVALECVTFLAEA